MLSKTSCFGSFPKSARSRLPFLKDRLLKDYAYYKTGGTCELLAAPESVEELADNVREIKRRNLPLQLLGGGTNSLVIDEHYPGAFVTFIKMNTLKLDGARIAALAGVDNSVIPALALGHKLSGASWMNGLPGQLGGTVRMNARCYGGEISQIVKQVTSVTRDGEIKVHTDPKMFRGYKDTIFMENGELVAEVVIELTPGGDPKEIQEKMLFCRGDREKKHQYDYPSCGCVFKNDYGVGVSSGILLDQAGAKQLKHQGAEVSPDHANFVYNKGATSRAILEISMMMRELVYDKFGVWMDYEMEVLGAMPQDLLSRFTEKRPPRWQEPRYADLLAPLRLKMAGR
jgi:UDP-N-acetylmuramate dehydrogenase